MVVTSSISGVVSICSFEEFQKLNENSGTTGSSSGAFSTGASSKDKLKLFSTTGSTGVSSFGVSSITGVNSSDTALLFGVSSDKINKSSPELEVELVTAPVTDD
ncbi:MAG: hypothetical protein LBF15_00830 [Candidatus Peribacteria bacterium]|nr:hypothetical protein [Candidatus Peribacteria bacterium]